MKTIENSLPLHFDWSRFNEAAQEFERRISAGENVRFVFSEHDYSAGYWIEDNSEPFKPSATRTCFLEADLGKFNKGKSKYETYK